MIFRVVIVLLSSVAGGLAAPGESVIETLIARTWQPLPVTVEWSSTGALPLSVAAHEDWTLTSQLPARPCGALIVQLERTSAGGESSRVSVSGNCRVRVDTYTVDRTISAGQPLAATDLVPTLRALLGMPAAAGLDGMPLLGASGDRPGAVQSSLGAFDVGRASDMVFSFKYAQSYNADMSQAAIVRGDGDGDGCDAGDGPIGNSFAVRDRRWSLLCDTSERDMESSKALDEAPAAKGRPRFTAYGKKYRYRLYDRIADPGETTDVTARFPAEARRLALALRAEVRRAPLRLPPERPTMTISPEIEDELRGLGYVK